mgnify:CR=1 FL=1
MEWDSNDRRLDVFLSKKLKVNRSQAQKMIDQDLVSANKKLLKKAGSRVKEGDEIEIEHGTPAPEQSSVRGKALSVEHLELVDDEKKKKDLKIERLKDCKIVGETTDYVVIEKSAGVLVHPTEAGETGTLVNWLLSKYPEIKKVGDPSSSALGGLRRASPSRPGIVHRLDREASGLLVVAKNQKMFECLKKQFQDRTVEKEYLVLVYGKMDRQHDTIDFTIDRGKDGKMVSRPKADLLKLKSLKSVQPGREALTEFTVEKEFGRFSFLRVKIHTGRTHQIRVHLFAYNHPVIGDNLYFNRNLIKKNETKLNRLFLHAAKLCFTDLAGEKQCFESKLPEELEGYLTRLG